MQKKYNLIGIILGVITAISYALWIVIGRFTYLQTLSISTLWHLFIKNIPINIFRIIFLGLVGFCLGWLIELAIKIRQGYFSYPRYH